MKCKKKAIVGFKLVMIILVVLGVALVLAIILKIDILKYFQFIPDYGTPNEKDIDADKFVDVPVVPETTKPFLVQITDEKGNLVQNLNFLDNINLNIDKGGRKCVNYKITPFSKGESSLGTTIDWIVRISQSETKSADVNSEKEIISVENYIRTQEKKLGEKLINSYYLKIEIVCLDSSGKAIGKGESQVIIIFTPKIIDLGFYSKGLGDALISVDKPVEIGKDISLIVSHTGCEKIETSLFKRIERRFWFDSTQEIQGIELQKKDNNKASYILKNLQTGKYFAKSSCISDGNLINKKQTEKDLEII